MGGFFGNAHYRNGFDFLEVHRAVATQAVVLRRHLSSSIGEAPRRICENRPEALAVHRSEEHTSELQSLMRISYAVFCLNKKHKETTRINSSQPSTQHHTPKPTSKSHISSKTT